MTSTLMLWKNSLKQMDEKNETDNSQVVSIYSLNNPDTLEASDIFDNLIVKNTQNSFQKRKKIIQNIFFFLFRLSALINGLALVIVIYFIVSNGWRAISWDFLTLAPTRLYPHPPYRFPPAYLVAELKRL